MVMLTSDLGSVLKSAQLRGDAVINSARLSTRIEKEYQTPDWLARMAVGRTGDAFHRTVATPSVHYDRLVKLFRGSVFIAAGAIANKISSMGVKVRRVKKRKTGAYREEVSPNHPLVELLEDPHPDFTQFDLHYYSTAWKLICGDAYFQKQKNGFGIPVRLNILSPQWVQIIPGEDRFIDAYRVNSLYLGTKEWDVDRSEMVHLRQPNLDWSSTRRFYGLATSIAAENTIELETEMMSRLRHNFSNYARPGLIFTTEKRYNEATLKQQVDSIWSQHRLAEHQGKPMVVHDGMTLAGGDSKKQDELDYRGSLEDTLKLTSAVFGVPLAIVGLIGEQNRSNAEASLYHFAHNTINPHLVQYSQVLTKQLAVDFDKGSNWKLEIQVGPFEVRDFNELVKAMEVLWRSGSITPNEVRDRLMNLPPLKIGGDTPMVPAGVTPATYGNEPGTGLLTASGDEQAGVPGSFLSGI